MSADVQRSPAPDLFDRLVRWVLDPDGVMYGDERERLRHYESSTLVASLHSVLVPWTLLVCAVVGGRAVAPVVLAVAGVFVVPWLLGAGHIRRRQVRSTPTRITRVFVATALLTWLPYPLLVLVLTRQFTAGSDSGFARGFWFGVIGGAIGGAVAGVIGLVRQHRAEHRQAPLEDDE
jgi:hypothetical protein